MLPYVKIFSVSNLLFSQFNFKVVRMLEFKSYSIVYSINWILLLKTLLIVTKTNQYIKF